MTSAASTMNADEPNVAPDLCMLAAAGSAREGRLAVSAGGRILDSPMPGKRGSRRGQPLPPAAVSRESLRLGDLVFFRDASGYVFHVGLFAGDMQFLHAAHAGDVIKYSSLEEPYYAYQFAGARHIAD